MPFKRDEAKRTGKAIKNLSAPPSIPEEAILPETKRVRILRSINGSRHGSFAACQVVWLDATLARSWVGMGLAEEDKSLDGPTETK